MVFNVVFRNVDNHLKNHSFIYNIEKDIWNLTLSYDLTYAFNPIITFKPPLEVWPLIESTLRLQ